VLFLAICRGVSSTVRRCVEKSSGRQYAVKIFEMSDATESTGDESTSLAIDEELEELRKSTMKEVDILRRCAGQPHISESFPHPGMNDMSCLFVRGRCIYTLAMSKPLVGTNLIHDFMAVTFSVKLTSFREKR